MTQQISGESALGRMIERLAATVNDGIARARHHAERYEHQYDSHWLTVQIRDLDRAIEAMKPDRGYELTPEGKNDLSVARVRRRGLQDRWDELTRPTREYVDKLNKQLWELEQRLKKVGHAEGETDRIARLCEILSALDPFLTPVEKRGLAIAKNQVLSHRAQSRMVQVKPPQPEPEEGSLDQGTLLEYLPAASDLDFDPGDDEIVESLASRRFDAAEEYRLNLAAQHLSLVSGFDVLLCLQLLRGVEQYPHQINTARQVLRTMRGRALLCDEVGLGKTVEAGLILKEYLVRGLARRVLVLAPPALVSQWRDEMKDKFGIEFITHDDPEFRALGEGAWEATDRVIASLHTAKSSTNSAAIQALTYDVIIVDEAHHLKNRATVNWKFVNGLKSKYLLLLTATPVQNDLDELFNLITLLSPGQLKTAAAFRREFVARGDARTPRNRNKLRELLMDVMVRNTRSQVSVALPPRRAATLRVHLSSEERALYDATTRFVRESGRGKAAERFLMQTLQMEVGSSPRALRSTLESIRARGKRHDPELDELRDLAAGATVSAKAEALLDLLRQRPDKILVFTRFRETQRFLIESLERAGLRVAGFSGEMTAAEKDSQVAAFARDRQVMVSTDVGSEGRNLQFCHTLVNYDLPWNPMLIEQRVGRVHRIGQTEPVLIFNLAAHDTVEDYVLDVLDSKINMFELVVGEVGEILGNLDEDREFEDVVMDLWMSVESPEVAREAFDRLGDQLVEARRKYEEARTYDENLFGEDFVAEE